MQVFFIIFFLFFGKKAENITLTFTYKSKGIEGVRRP